MILSRLSAREPEWLVAFRACALQSTRGSGHSAGVLSIRDAQIVMLASGAPGSFLARATEHVRRHVPALGTTTDAELLALVRAGWLRARSAHGLRSERDVIAFVRMYVELGDGFDDQDWARSILRDPDVPSSSERVRRLEAAHRARVERNERNTRIREAFFRATEAGE